MSTGIMESISIPRPYQRSFTSTLSPRATATVYDFGGKGFAFNRGGLRILKVGRRSAFDAIGSALSRPRIGIRRSGTVVCEAQDTAIDVRDVTKDTWKSLVIESEKPVLVEFWAPWCGPCRMILPLVGKLSKMYEGKIKCYKLNTDESPDIATQYGIRSIPTIMMFKNGEKKDVVIGAVPESTLVNCIQKFV